MPSESQNIHCYILHYTTDIPRVLKKPGISKLCGVATMATAGPWLNIYKHIYNICMYVCVCVCVCKKVIIGIFFAITHV